MSAALRAYGSRLCLERYAVALLCVCVFASTW